MTANDLLRDGDRLKVKAECLDTRAWYPLSQSCQLRR